jgi:outer membrane receptor protein involved in Fe transport
MIELLLWVAALQPGLAIDETRTVEVVQVTASRIEKSVFDSSAAVNVLDAEAMAVETPQVISDLLWGQPGVFVQQTTPGQGIPIIRGLKGSENLHLVDGMRLNNAFFRNAPNQYLALVDVNDLSRLEVVRGPASALYGSDAMGGVVQLLTVEPRFDESYLEAQSRLTLASADRSYGWSGSAQGGDQDSAWRAQASYTDVGDRRTGNSQRIKPSAYESRAFNSRYRRRLEAGGDFTLGLQYLRQPSTPRVDELIPGFGQSEPDSQQFFFQPNERTFLHARLRNDLESQWADDYQLNLAWQEIRDDRLTQNFGSSEQRRERNSSQLWGLTGQFTRAETLVGDLLYGFEFYHDKVDSQRLGTDLESGLTRPLVARFPDGSTQASTAVFANTVWSLGADTELSTGARYSRSSVDIAQADRPGSAEVSANDLTLNLGLTHAFNDNLNLVSNYGQGFRAPNIFDLATLGERPGNRFNIANDELTPERVDSLDAGLKWQSASLQGELFAFYSEYSDKITSVATGELTDSGRQIVQSQNVNEVTLYGLELATTWQISPAFDFRANLNWTRGRERDADGIERDADRMPPLNGRLALDWMLNEAMVLSLWSDFADRQDRLSDRDRRDPRINPSGTPAWATANIRLDWTLPSHWRLGLSVENLFDRAYREHGSGIDATGINGIASLTYTF